MLLLHLMAQIFPQKIRAIYIDHQLQDQSAEWAEVVATQATILNIPYIIQKVQIANGNLEAQARQARYQAYQQHSVACSSSTGSGRNSYFAIIVRCGS